MDGVDPRAALEVRPAAAVLAIQAPEAHRVSFLAPRSIAHEDVRPVAPIHSDPVMGVGRVLEIAPMLGAVQPTIEHDAGVVTLEEVGGQESAAPDGRATLPTFWSSTCRAAS